MALGPRVLKTGIAVTIALYLGTLLNLPSPVIAAVATIFAVQPTIYRSWRYLLDQLKTNTLGAIIALCVSMVFPHDPIIVGLTCIVVIMICLQIKMEITIGVTLVTVISVMEASGRWDYAAMRFLQTIVGIGVAAFVNVVFFPPKPEVQYLKQLDAVFHRMSLLLRTAVSDEMKESSYRAEHDKLHGEIMSLQDKFKLFDEESRKLKRAKYKETRRVVVYKQMLTTLLKGAEVLEAIENHFFQSPRSEESTHVFDHHLEMLTKAHEHVLLKLDNKVKPDRSYMDRLEMDNQQFLRRVMNDNMENASDEGRLTIVAAACYEYGFQIHRLDRLAGHVEMEEKVHGQ